MDTMYVKQEKRHFRPGTSVFEVGMLLRLEVEGFEDSILVQPMEGGIIVLGRRDPEDSYQPDVDLLPYMAHEYGISRRHAAITCTSTRVEIRDLRSSNGTYLNNVLLDPNEPHQMRDGDSIRLAGLSITVHFQD